jgi:hypothetical protein
MQHVTHVQPVTGLDGCSIAFYGVGILCLLVLVGAHAHLQKQQQYVPLRLRQVPAGGNDGFKPVAPPISRVVPPAKPDVALASAGPEAPGDASVLNCSVAAQSAVCSFRQWRHESAEISADSAAAPGTQSSMTRAPRYAQAVAEQSLPPAPAEPSQGIEVSPRRFLDKWSTDLARRRAAATGDADCSQASSALAEESSGFAAVARALDYEDKAGDVASSKQPQEGVQPKEPNPSSEKHDATAMTKTSKINSCCFVDYRIISIGMCCRCGKWAEYHQQSLV